MNNEPVAWLLFRDGGESYPEYTTSYKQMREWETYLGDNERIEPHYTHPAKTLTDEEWNKAFDYYCETDEGVLKFDLELRDEWKKEQLIRWKEALRKAQDK